MGNDGGSIPKRRELVKEAARLPTVSELKATALESLAYAWSYDPVSSELLDLENAVSDWRGRLYNYETVLRGLIPGDGEGQQQAEAEGGGDGNAEAEGGGISFASTGIRSVRDVVRLKFKRYATAAVGSKDTNKDKKPMWACPVSLKELGPSTKSVYLVPCGHVFAEVAIKEIHEHVCPECSEPFKEENVIAILPTDQEELKRLRQRMEDLRGEGLTHSLKKGKSNGRKKRKAEDGENGNAAAPPAKKDKDKAHHQKSDISKRVGGINNAMAASVTAKVLAEQEERHKRRRLEAAR